LEFDNERTANTAIKHSSKQCEQKQNRWRNAFRHSEKYKAEHNTPHQHTVVMEVPITCPTTSTGTL